MIQFAVVLYVQTVFLKCPINNEEEARFDAQQTADRSAQAALTLMAKQNTHNLNQTASMCMYISADATLLQHEFFKTSHSVTLFLPAKPCPPLISVKPVTLSL